MKKNNNFDAFDKPNDFDEMLFNYFDKKDENIPLSTQNTIKNALKNTHKQKNISFTMLKRIAIFIISFGIIIATTVYAKDIINFLTSIFTNSNSGIDTAVENGYVQNVDMDFIECNNVGVKVDYILMDDHNLDISFVYKYFGESVNITELKYVDLTIKDEQDNIICFISEDTVENNDIADNNIYSIYSSNEQEVIDSTTIRDSLLVTSEKFPSSKTLYISIQKITLTSNNEIHYISGNWNFSINLDNKLVTRNSYEYYSTDNSLIDNIKTSITATSLSIELQLNTLFDEAILYTQNAITLTDESNNAYIPTKMLSKNNNTSEPYSSNITLLYPISIYDNINKLYLHINLSSDKQIDIELIK